MSGNRKYGTPYQEALLALSHQVARIYREECVDGYRIDVDLIQGDTLIAVTVTSHHSGQEAWVPLEIGAEGWDEHRRARIIHEVSYVIGERLKVERFVADYVAAKVRGIIDAYR